MVRLVMLGWHSLVVPPVMIGKNSLLVRPLMLGWPLSDRRNHKMTPGCLC